MASQNRSVIYFIVVHSFDVIRQKEFQRVLVKKTCVIWLDYLNFIKYWKWQKIKSIFDILCLFIFEKVKMLRKRRCMLCTVRVPLTIPRAISSSDSFMKTILILMMHHVLDDLMKLIESTSQQCQDNYVNLVWLRKADVLVPHELMEKNLIGRISACDSLLKRNEIDPFLKWMVTVDEK